MAGIQLHTRNTAPVVLIAACLASSAIWILNDQRVWSWDQAAYGYATLRLWEAGLSGVGAWADAMMHTLGGQQPLMVWIGQAFVPLRQLTGEFESALLLLNLLAAAGALTLVYCSTRRLGASVLGGMIGILVCGGSGLFIGLTHIYLVEMTQCFTAAAMMFVACRAEKRPLARTVGLGIFAVALSFLSKSSSMTFVLPMVTYMVVALFINRRNVRVGAQYPDALLIVIAGITAAAAVTWYTINWQNVVQHFINATISDYTLHWGSPVNLGVKLQFWSGWFLKSLSPFPLVSGGIVALIVASFATSIVQLYKRPTGEWLEASVQTGLLFALSLAGTIIATLFVFSLQINEDTRFLLPLIPAAGILVAWSVSTVRSPIVRMLVFSALALNAGVGHVYAHGSNPFHIAPHNYLSSVDLSPDGKALLTETVRSSCQRESAGRLNFIIVSYATLNGNTINFYSEKNGEMGGYRCSYTTFGANEVDINHALDRINAVEPSYIVTVAPDKQPPPDFVNVVSRAVSEHLAHDPQYVLAPGSGSYLLIYRNTKPSN